MARRELQPQVIASGTAVFVQLVSSAATSTDATLSALAIEDASNGTPVTTFNPAFTSATSTYSVWVANGVTQVTVDPTASSTHATIRYLDGSNSVIADADGNKDGHQVEPGGGGRTRSGWRSRPGTAPPSGHTSSP